MNKKLNRQKTVKHIAADFGTLGLLGIFLLIMIAINVSTGVPLHKTTASDNATTTSPMGIQHKSHDTPFQQSKKTVHLYGTPLHVGDVINTDYTVDNPSKVIDKVSTQKLSTLDNKWRVIQTVPSIDTPICSLQTKILGVLAEHNKNVDFVTISQDLPFAQNRYKQSTKIKNLHLFSDYRGKFSKDNHLLIKETKLNARAIMVVDPNNKIQYIQYAHDEVAPLDLDKAMKVIKQNQN